MVGLLLLQLLLGIGANIRLTLPDAGSLARTGLVTALHWALFDAPILLRAHVAAGILLTAGSLLLLAIGLRARQPVQIIPSFCGFAGILAAGISGTLFVATAHSLYAAIMTGGLVAGIVSYGVGLYLTAPPQTGE